MRAYSRRPKNAAELAAERHLIRAEAFRDAIGHVRAALRTGFDVDGALEGLESFARTNDEEARYYAPEYAERS